MVAAELAAWFGSARRAYGDADFRAAAESVLLSRKVSLLEASRQGYLSRTQRIRGAEARIRETFLAASNVASGVESIRVSRRLLTLTWIIAIASVLLLLDAISRFVKAQ
jgi:hypothetical protein